MHHSSCWKWVLGVSISVVIGACGGGAGEEATQDDDVSGDTGSNGGSSSSGGGDHGSFSAGDGGTGAAAEEVRDPTTCEEAKATKSYVGCEYWPVLLPSHAGYMNGAPGTLVGCGKMHVGLVIANTGPASANVTVTGPSGFSAKVVVPQGQAKEVDIAEAMDAMTKETGVFSGGSYRVTSSVPVVAYQYTPYDFTLNCVLVASAAGMADAVLLMPTPAMTGNYRVLSSGSAKAPSDATLPGGFNQPDLVLTATAPQTKVTVRLGARAAVLASKTGPSIAATSAHGTITFTLAKAGDIARLVGPDKSDFGGSLVKADKPVQVMTNAHLATKAGVGMFGQYDESVLPAETLGREYVINTPPPDKNGTHDAAVRFYGNKDGTQLTYVPAKPAGCPDKLDAGQVGDCTDLIDHAFAVNGSAEFGVMMFVRDRYEQSGQTIDTGSQTTIQSTEQFRSKYIFMGYEPPANWFGDGATWANITAPKDAVLKLDGKPIDASSWKAVGTLGLGVLSVAMPKTGGKGGQHVLTSDKPVGVQIIGRGYPTSFAYPAGLNLKPIAPPPVK